MKTNMSKIIKVTAVLASLAGIVTAMGFGCGMGFQPMGAASQNGFADLGSNVNQNQDLVVVEGTKTVGITNFTSVLDAMTSITNVPASTNTKNVFNTKLASFSETKSALTINAPMLLSYVAVGAEVCNDLIVNEQAALTNVNNVVTNNRRFFVGSDAISLNNNSTNGAIVNDAIIEQWVRRLARQAWGRNETPDELAMIKAGVAEMRSVPSSVVGGKTIPAVTNTTAGLTRQMALYTCTAVLASTSGYEI